METKSGFMSVLKRTIQKEKLLTLGLIITIAGSIGFALIPPLLLERIVNQLTVGEAVMLRIAIIYVCVLAISSIFDAGKEVLITIFGQKITRGIRHEMCAKLTRLPAHYFSVNETGKITSQFVNDVDTVEALFHNGIISMVVDVCKVVSILIVIFVKSLGLGILMLVVTPLLFGMTRMFQKRMLRAQIENRIAMGKVNNHVPETIGSIRMIHSLYKQEYMQQRYDDYIQESYSAMERSNRYDSLYSPIIIFTSACVISVMMVLSAMGSGMQSFFGVSVGTAVALIAYVGKVFEPLESIGMEIQNIQSAVAGVKRINELLNEDERVKSNEHFSGDQSNNVKGDCVSFRQVTFGYGDNNVLENFDCCIHQGEHITLAGRTGAGKSTAFRLILGLYSPLKGMVRIFGKEADQIPDREKRKLFGYVPQSFQMVSGTVAEQISLFDESISREQVVCAARLVGLDEMILELERGYDTIAEETLFSQGQLQLLAIARAVVEEPVIMLLDEITANLDSNTEQHVIEALERTSRNRTVISISHRLYEQGENSRCVVLHTS